MVVGELEEVSRVVAAAVVVAVALRPVAVPLSRAPEIPRKAPAPGEPASPAVLLVVVAAARFGPFVGGALDLLESIVGIVGAVEKPVPRASQPRPQRPWAARAKAIENATRASTEKPATRTGRRVCQPWASAANGRNICWPNPPWPARPVPSRAKNGGRRSSVSTSVADVGRMRWPAGPGGLDPPVGLGSSPRS